MKQFLYSILVAMLVWPANVLVQAQDKTEKGTINIALTYSQLNEELPIIRVSAKTKKERKFEPVEGVEVNLFFGTETSSGFLGRIILKINPLNLKSQKLKLN